MKEYRAFGLRLRSEIPFPELPAGDGSVEGSVDGDTVTVRRASGSPEAEGEAIGEESLGTAGRLRLFRSGDALRLVHDGGDSYSIRPRRGLVEWHPEDGDAASEITRSVVLGRVLPVLLYGRGCLPLHASAACVGDRAVGFAAPKGHGKSTLALTLATRGATLLADDTLAVEAGDPVRARPGTGHAKVWDDAADALGIELPDRGPIGSVSAPDAECRAVRRKFLVTAGDTPSLRWRRSPAELAAIYLLIPADPVGERDPDAASRPPEATGEERELVPTVEASTALVTCTKAGELLHGAEGPGLLERASRLAERVPVYAVRTGRTLFRLGELADEIAVWHGDTRGAARREAR